MKGHRSMVEILWRPFCDQISRSFGDPEPIAFVSVVKAEYAKAVAHGKELPPSEIPNDEGKGSGEKSRSLAAVTPEEPGDELRIREIAWEVLAGEYLATVGDKPTGPDTAPRGIRGESRNFSRR
jgi:hypothetical protein